MNYVIQLEHNHQLPKAVENLVSEYLKKQIADNRVPEFESLADETVFSFQYLLGSDSAKPSERVIVSSLVGRFGSPGMTPWVQTQVNVV